MGGHTGAPIAEGARGGTRGGSGRQCALLGGEQCFYRVHVREEPVDRTFHRVPLDVHKQGICGAHTLEMLEQMSRACEAEANKLFASSKANASSRFKQGVCTLSLQARRMQVN